MERDTIVIFLDSSQLGGIESHVYHLAKALKKSGRHTEIWFYKKHSDSHPLEPRFNDEHIEYRYLNGTLIDLWSALKKKSPILLHTHGYKAGVLGRMIAKVQGIPAVSTFHNGDPGAGIVRLYTWLDRITSPLSVNIAVSEEIAHRFGNKPVQINNFIDLPKQQNKTNHSISFVGRLSHEKGPDQFLQLAKHIPDMDFRIYGTGPMEKDLIKQNIANVQFMGQMSGMNDQWHTIDLLCITSRHEGLPMVALEAMAHGVPVISFAMGALPELIQQGINGWIAPAGNIKGISSFVRLWQALPETVKNQIRQSCIQTISKSYSYEAVLPLILDIYGIACQQAGVSWSGKQQKVTHNKITLSGD